LLHVDKICKRFKSLKKQIIKSEIVRKLVEHELKGFFARLNKLSKKNLKVKQMLNFCGYLFWIHKNKIKMKFNLSPSDVKYLKIANYSNQYSQHFALRE